MLSLCRVLQVILFTIGENRRKKKKERGSGIEFDSMILGVVQLTSSFLDAFRGF